MDQESSTYLEFYDVLLRLQPIAESFGAASVLNRGLGCALILQNFPMKLAQVEIRILKRPLDLSGDFEL